MRALTALVVRLSTSRRAVVLLLVAFGASFALLQLAATGFRSVSGGFEPFDLQNGLTSGEVRAQLLAYEDGATGRYLLFDLIDWFFPLLGSLVIAVVTAACLRNALPALYERAVRWGLFALFFLPALFDWAENVLTVRVVAGGSPPSGVAVDLMIIAKQLKLVTLTAAQVVAFVAVFAWIGRALRDAGRQFRAD